MGSMKDEFNREITDAESAKLAMDWALERSQSLSLSVQDLKQQVDQKERIVKLLQKESLDLQRQNQTIEFEKSSLNQKVQTLQEQYSSISTQLSDKQSEIALYNQEKQNAVFYAQKELEMWKKEARDLRAKLEASQSGDFIQFQKEVRSEEIDQYKDQLRIFKEKSEKQKELYQHQIEQLEEWVHERDEKNKDLQDKLYALEMNTPRVRQKLTSEMEQMKLLIQEKEMRLLDNEQKLTILESKWRFAEQKATDAWEKDRMHETAQLELSLKIKNLESELKTYKESVEPELTKLQEIIHEKDRQISEIKTNVHTYELDLSQAKSSIQEMNDIINNWKSQDSTHKDHIANLNTSQEQWQKEVDDIKKALQEKSEELHEMRELVLTKDEQIKKLQNRLDEAHINTRETKKLSDAANLVKLNVEPPPILEDKTAADPINQKPLAARPKESDPDQSDFNEKVKKLEQSLSMQEEGADNNDSYPLPFNPMAALSPELTEKFDPSQSPSAPQNALESSLIAPGEPLPPAALTQRSEEHKKILVAEYNEESLNRITQVLTKSGYAVYPTLSGDKLVDIALEKLPDLIILNVAVSGMDCYSICRELANNISTEIIPVLLLASDPSAKEIFEEAPFHSIQGFLCKPFSVKEFLTTVDQVLTQKTL